MKIAILDDYQGVALSVTDWSPLEGVADITVFQDTLSDVDALSERLAPFEIICIMRERTLFHRPLLERLPNLRLLASTGPRNAAIDAAYATERGIEITHTGYFGSPTIELAWALILASARNVVEEAVSVRQGGWQVGLGTGLAGKTLGVAGLGNVGGAVAKIGIAFGMKVIAWSENLTAEKAAESGVEAVDKETLFARSDFLTIHLVLSDRTRALVDKQLLGLMKETSILINTSRGPIVDEGALLEALGSKRLAGAAIDVFDVEPLPPFHPFRSAKGLLATPHIGYVSRELYQTFYADTVSNIQAWIARQ